MQERVRPAKRAVNLSVDAELLDEAKAAQINLSALLEGALKDTLKERRWRRWREENRKSTESMNRYVEKHGLPLRKYRVW